MRMNNVNSQKVDFVIKPKRGQFLVLKGDFVHSIILPIPSSKTKGVLMFPVHLSRTEKQHKSGYTIVGPTAEDQSSRTDISISDTVAKWLFTEAKKKLTLSESQDLEVVGQYVGLRPATQYRDYQIRCFADQQWISVSGIRSTGLSASLGISEYVADLYSTNIAVLNAKSSVILPSKTEMMKLNQRFSISHNINIICGDK